MADTTFSVDQLIGKTLYAKKSITAYANTSKTKVVKTYKSGERIGIIDSWLDKQGTIWWMLYPPNNYAMPYYVEHIANSIDTDALKRQGALTISEDKKAKEKKKLEDRSSIDKISDAISKTAENTASAFQNTSQVAKYIAPAAAIAAVAIVGLMVFKNTDKITEKILSK